MSLFNSMSDVGRPISYFPKLAHFFGSVNASIFFSQLFYWQERMTNNYGVYKTSQEWEEETGLSYREQVTVRKYLISKNFLIETHKRLEHKIYFKLNQDAIDAAFGEWTKAHFAEQQKRISPNDENAVREEPKTQFVYITETTTEITSETTTDIKDIGAIAPVATKFVIPSIEDVKEHIAYKKYNVDAESFIAFYSSNGWMVGKNKMKCWKSALVTWAKRSSNKGISYVTNNTNNEAHAATGRKLSLVEQGQQSIDRIEARERREQERVVN